MALSMSLSATSYSITATVSGLDASYTGNRRFSWYLDGAAVGTETVEPGGTTHTHTIEPVYFGSTHSVRCEIRSADGSQLFATLTGSATTGYATVELWDWTRSNGTSTAMQTIAAHTALANRGATADMNYRVWNDLVNKLHYLLTHSGIPWDNRYAAFSELPTVSRGELTARMMNAAVQNVGYSRWSWRDDPTAPGYLDRLAFHGVSEVGKAADEVKGRYLLELAEKLNIIIRIYTNGAGLVPIGGVTALHLTHSAAARTDAEARLAAASDLALTAWAALEAKRKGDLTAASLLTIAMHSALRSSESARAAGSINLRLSTSAYGRASHSARVTASGALALTQDADMDATESLLLDAATALAIAAQAALDVKRKGDLTAGTVVTLAHGANAEQSAPVHASSGTFVFLLPEADISQEMCAEEAAAVSLSVATTALLEATVGEWRLPYWVGDGMLHVPQSKQVVQTGTRIKIT